MQVLASVTSQPTKSNLSAVVRFRELAMRLSQLGASVGVNIAPFSDQSLPHFANIPTERQNFAIDDLQRYLSICEDTINRGHSLKNAPQFLWSALKKFGFRPTSDFFQYIDSESMIEIHNREFQQIFRTFNFYECCSYTIEDLYCFPWTSLYRHESHIETNLIILAAEMYGGKHSATKKLDWPIHMIEELSSKNKYVISAHMKYCSPLFEEGTGVVGATAIIETGTVLNPRRLNLEGMA
ncbi:MAG TPA: hypothetical protein VM432_13555 [Bdellovibrionales bacterium]|jgi:hypothetical protein|nr:hypothetical protein [Bdellovibrionales bacterium]